MTWRPPWTLAATLTINTMLTCTPRPRISMAWLQDFAALGEKALGLAGGALGASGSGHPANKPAPGAGGVGGAAGGMASSVGGGPQAASKLSFGFEVTAPGLDSGSTAAAAVASRLL